MLLPAVARPETRRDGQLEGAGPVDGAGAAGGPTGPGRRVAVHSVASAARGRGPSRQPARAPRRRACAGHRQALRAARAGPRSSRTPRRQSCGEARGTAVDPSVSGRQPVDAAEQVGRRRGRRRRWRRTGAGAQDRRGLLARPPGRSRATTTCSGSRRRPARPSASATTSIGRGRPPTATLAPPQRRPLQDAARRGRSQPSARPSSRRPVARARRASVASRSRRSPCARRPRRTSATVPGEPCSRKRRRHGSGQRRGEGCASASGTPGSRRSEHADGEPDQLLLGEPCGVDGRAAEPSRPSGQGSGTSTSAAPRGGGGEHQVGQCRRRATGRHVEPADQLEVDARRERGAELRTPRCRVAVEPRRPGRRTSGAEVGSPAGDGLVVRRRHQPRSIRVRRATAPASSSATGVRRPGRARARAPRWRRRRRPSGSAWSGSAQWPSSSGQTGSRSARSPTTSTPERADVLQPGRGDLVDRGPASRRHGGAHLVRPLGEHLLDDALAHPVDVDGARHALVLRAPLSRRSMVTSAPPSEALVVSLSAYDARGLSPSTLANRSQSALPRPVGRRDRDEVDPLGRQRRAPGREDARAGAAPARTRPSSRCGCSCAAGP